MNKIILKRLFPYLRKYLPRFLQSALCMVMVALLTSGTVWVIRTMVDDVLIAKNWKMLLWITLAMPVLFLVKGVFTYLQNYLTNYISQGIVRDIRLQLYDHLQRLSVDFYHNNSTGRLMSVLTNDIGLLQNSISTVPVQIIRDGSTVLFLMGTIFYLHWKFALFTLFLLPVAVFPITILGRKMRSSGRIVQAKMADLFSSIQETISAQAITKIYCKEAHEVQRFKLRNDDYYSESMRWVRADVLGAPVMEFLGSIAAAALLWYGGRDVIHGVWTTGSFFSFLGASISAYKPIKEFTGVNGRIQQGVACAERIFKLLDEPLTIRDKENCSELSPLTREINFENVNFSYSGNADELILKNINLKVRKGEIVALVGSSGSGKTTLVQLLPRLFDVTSGGLFIDGINVKDVSLKSLRAQIGMVTQETILFNETVSYNLRYGLVSDENKLDENKSDENKLDEKVNQAAQIANAHEFILSLPQGYDTVIGERGVRLSGGQRQRLSIARAILKNPPILILDEATSALDNESERLVQQALERLMEQRTVFVVAHRLSTVRKANRILVLDQGKIVEEGTHDQLLSSSGHYQKLYKTEFQAEN